MIHLKSLLTEVDAINMNGTNISGKFIKNKNSAADPWLYFISDNGAYYAQKSGGEWKDLKATLSPADYTEATNLINQWRDGKKAPIDTANANSSNNSTDTKTKSTIDLGNGIKYAGQTVNGIPNGKGTVFYANGDKYVGDVKDNMSHGKGIYIWSSGMRYVGEFKDDKIDGKGTAFFTDSSKYVGEFKDNQKNGKGTLYYKNYAYTGTWKDGKYYSKDGKMKGVSRSEIIELIDKIDRNY